MSFHIIHWLQWKWRKDKMAHLNVWKLLKKYKFGDNKLKTAHMWLASMKHTFMTRTSLHQKHFVYPTMARHSNVTGTQLAPARHDVTFLELDNSGMEVLAVLLKMPTSSMLYAFTILQHTALNISYILHQSCEKYSWYVFGDFNGDMIQENENPIHKNFLAAGFTKHIKNRSIRPELTTAKTGPIHLSSLVEIAFVDWFTKLLLINISIYMNI